MKGWKYIIYQCLHTISVKCLIWCVNFVLRYACQWTDMCFFINDYLHSQRFRPYSICIYERNRIYLLMITHHFGQMPDLVCNHNTSACGQWAELSYWPSFSGLLVRKNRQSINSNQKRSCLKRRSVLRQPIFVYQCLQLKNPRPRLKALPAGWSRPRYTLVRCI